MKTFTLEEANALIPRLNRLLTDLIDARDKLAAMGDKIQSLLQHVDGNGGSKHGNAYVVQLEIFNARLSALQDIGCELKDLDQGLVDFPSYRDGRLVYLCWKRGEDRIRFWHDLDAGFAGRQPI
jgi:hypothetical protein